MTAATVNATGEAVDFDALAEDVRRKVAEAEAVEGRLALDSLGDPAVATELQDVQSERAAAESELHKIELAHREREHREAQAVEKAEADELAKVQRARAAAKSQARKSAAQVDAAIREVYVRIADDENVIAKEAEFARREAELLGEGEGIIRPLYPVGQYQVAFQRLAEPAELYGRLGFEHGTQNPRSLAEQRSEN